MEELLVCMKKLKNGKAAGDDDLTPEMMKALPAFGIRELHRLIVNIWERKEVPDSWRNAIIVPLLKKGSPTDPANYRGISLIRVCYKLVERLLLLRIVEHREKTARDEQHGFRPGRSTIDAVFSLRRIVELRARFKKPTYIIFVDFRAAFDSPDRDRLFDAVRADGVPAPLVDLLRDLYSRTTAAVRTPCGITQQFAVRTGVRQGSVCGPLLFNYVIDDVMRRVVEECGGGVELHPTGRKVTDLDYADDIALLGEDPVNLQKAVDRLSLLAASYGLTLRPDKCESMTIPRGVKEEFTVNGEKIAQTTNFRYLGSWISSDADLTKDVEARIAQACSAFNSLEKVLWRSSVANHVKLRIYLTAIRPAMLYGSGTWALNKKLEEKLDTAERKFLRRMLGYFYPNRRHNSQLYRDVNNIYSRLLRKKSKLPTPSRQVAATRVRLLGHVLRREDHRIVKQAALTLPPPEWRRGPGRKRATWDEKLKEDVGPTPAVRAKVTSRDTSFRRAWNTRNGQWMDAVMDMAQDRVKWSELVHTMLAG